MSTVRSQTIWPKRRKKSAGVRCRETLSAPVPGEPGDEDDDYAQIAGSVANLDGGRTTSHATEMHRARHYMRAPPELRS